MVFMPYLDKTQAKPCVRLFYLLCFHKGDPIASNNNPPPTQHSLTLIMCVYTLQYIHHAHTSRSPAHIAAASIMMRPRPPTQTTTSLSYTHPHKYTYTHNTHLSTGVFSLLSVSGERGHHHDDATRRTTGKSKLYP